MKKLLLVLAIGAFVACNDSANSGDKSADTTTSTQQPAPDTTSTTPADTTQTGAVDTTAKAVDSVKK